MIRRQVLEIRVSDSDAAYAHSHRLSRLYRERLLPVLDRIFSEFTGEGETIRLDRLEVDLGVVSPHAPDEEIVRQLAEKLPAVLAEHLAKARLPGNVMPAGEGAADAAQTLFRDAIARTLELLDYFLSTGTLPWWAQPSEWENLPETLPEMISRAPQRFRQWLAGVLPDRTKRRRFIYQFPEPVLQAVAAATGAQKAEEQRRFLQEVLTRWLQRAVTAEVLQATWGLTLLFLLRNEISSAALCRAVEEIVREALPGSEPATRARVAMVREHLRQHPPERDIGIWLATQLDAAEKMPAISPPAADAPLREGIDEPGEAAEEGIFVQNAGLVLVAPFLAGFFTNLGVMQKGRFVSEKAQVRAVHLLQYVATGTAGGPEYRLPLNKILCGWPLTRPLPAKVRLRNREKQEAQQLLASVIRHWAVLKNTSIAGLQTAFLQRNGLLHREEDGWRLQVERKSYDMLLERLPWQISMIRNSWMEGLLRVEW